MSDSSTATDDETEPPLAILSDTADPGRLFNRDTVTTTVEDLEVDESSFEYLQSTRGMAIAGVTNDDGEVLLATNPEIDAWRLPHARVPDDIDYAETAVSDVFGGIGFDVTIDSVVSIRQFDAVLEGSDAEAVAGGSEGAEDRLHVDDPDTLVGMEGHTRSYDVAFEASLPSGHEPIPRESTESLAHVEWFDSIPDGAPRGLPREDLRLFID